MDTERSSFVDIVARIFGKFSKLGVIIALFQNIFILLKPMPVGNREASGFYGFLSAHLQLFLFGLLVFCGLLWLASTGLSQRKDWARLLFVSLLALNIASLLLGTILAQPLVDWSSLGAAEVVMKALPLAANLAFAGLFGWIISRLCAPEIRREFHSEASA